MKCLVVDDEAIARTRLKGMLSKIGGRFNVIEAENGRDALDKINDYSPELVLLDIRMPGMSGMEVAKHLTALDSPPAIIFTTAYNEYALDAFDANAIDYVLKPIRQERLEQALSKVQPIRREQTEALPVEEQRQHVAVTERGKIKLVPLEEIVFFKADNKYVRLRTVDDEYLISEVLNGLEEELSEDFIRIHRNALVAKSHIDGLEKNKETGKWYVYFRSVDDSLEVSRRQTAAVRRWLRNKV